MLSFRRLVMVLAAATVMQAQPALTTIQDILYRADGSRFSGEMFINWNAFQAGDQSNIATAQVKLPIVNGVLNVKLVPTTTASAGANYQVTYNSQGVFQFSQVWAVPPSSVVLRVKDVLVSEGTVVGGGGGSAGGITSQPVLISDVVGLTNALALLPLKGVGYTLGRAAVINTSGQIDGATGNLGDCVRVDGSSGPCGGNSGGILPLYSDAEVPTGTMNGLNITFGLAFTPSPATSVQVYLNGLLMDQGIDYTVTGSTLTFAQNATPQAFDILQVNYRYANPSNPLGSLTAAQVVCSAVGLTTTSNASTALGSCTLPAGLLATGDRVEVRYHFVHNGTSSGFTPQVAWGSTPVLSRAGSASDTAFVGTLQFSVGASAQPWSGQSWGSSLPFAVAVGSATVNTSQSVTIQLLGQMTGTTSDSLFLSNFTVVRYPAQVNP